MQQAFLHQPAFKDHLLSETIFITSPEWFLNTVYTVFDLVNQLNSLQNIKVIDLSKLKSLHNEI